MIGASIITTPKADWTELASRPAGWSVRRLERSDHTATYLIWDPCIVQPAIFLTPPTADLVAGLDRAGFTELTAADLTRTQVWTRPAGAAGLADAA